MAEARSTDGSGPDIWAIGAGWLALVLFFLTIDVWAWQQNYKDPWVIRGAIVTAACFLTWLFGYWSRIQVAAREWMRRGGLNAALVTVGVLLVAVGINYVLHRYHWQRDLTKNQRASISDRSQKVVRGLKEPVTVTAFFSKNKPEYGQASNLLRQYRDQSYKFRYRLMDPIENLDERQKVKLRTLEGVIFEYGDKREKRQEATEVSEKEWTTALLKFTREKQPKAYFLQGHGEMDFDAPMGTSGGERSLSRIADTLKEQQWQVEKLFLRGLEVKPLEPADAAVVVVADPMQPIAPEEEKRLNDYLGKGGRVLVTLSPGGPDLGSFLKPYALQVGNDRVVDLRFGTDRLNIEPSDSHAITRGIGLVVLFSCRSVTPANSPPTGVSPQSLLKSDEASIAVPPTLTNITLKDLNAPTTKKGAQTVAAVSTKSAAEGKPGAKESRVVALGTSLSFSDAVLAQGPLFHNRDFFTNCVNWLADQQELVSIEPKDTTPEQLPVTAQHTTLLAAIYWLEFPLIAIALGIYVYLKRR